MNAAPPVRTLAEIDPFGPDIVQEPHEFFAALRREAPLYRLPNGAYYLISRYCDVRDAVMKPEVFSSNLVAVLMQGQEQADRPQLISLEGGASFAQRAAGERSPSDVRAVDVLAIADPPVHARQRKLSNKAFSMRRVAALEPAIRALAESLVAAILPQRGARWSAADWVREVAVPLPMTVIAGLIGLPSDDIPQLKHWSDASVALLSGINTPAQLAVHAKQVNQLLEYLGRQVDAAAGAQVARSEAKPSEDQWGVARSEAKPSEDQWGVARSEAKPSEDQWGSDDVLGDLVRATRDEADALTRDEVVSILLQILTAGNETTTSLIGSALWLLLENPDVEARVRADHSLLEPFIEEALRLESPFHGHFRLVCRDTEVAGSPLPKGSRVMLLWGAANRDGDEFENPDAIDLARRNAKSHLGFGLGIHHCIGASLARLETRVALETLLARTSAMRLADAKIAHVPSLFVRSLQGLPVELAA